MCSSDVYMESKYIKKKHIHTHMQHEIMKSTCVNESQDMHVMHASIWVISCRYLVHSGKYTDTHIYFYKMYISIGTYFT